MIVVGVFLHFQEEPIFSKCSIYPVLTSLTPATLISNLKACIKALNSTVAPPPFFHQPLHTHSATERCQNVSEIIALWNVVIQEMLLFFACKLSAFSSGRKKSGRPFIHFILHFEPSYKHLHLFNYSSVSKVISSSDFMNINDNRTSYFKSGRILKYCAKLIPSNVKI